MNTGPRAQLVLPLLEVLAARPKGLSAAEAVEAVADRLGLDGEQRARRAPLPYPRPAASPAR